MIVRAQESSDADRPGAPDCLLAPGPQAKTAVPPPDCRHPSRNPRAISRTPASRRDRRGVRVGAAYASSMSSIDAGVLRRAHDFVSARFPVADGVVLGGSSASGTTTPTSDLDLLLIGPDEMLGGRGSSLAATYEHEGQLVEVFAYTADSYRVWAGREVAEHRPVILVMLAEGVVLREAPVMAELRRWAAEVLAAGPTPDRHALDVRRYRLSALLDDLTDATDPTEVAVLLSAVFEALAELLLLAHGRWLGSGKWLVRRLHAWDPDTARDLGGALVAGDRGALVGHARRLLEPLGGPLQAGMVR